MAIVHYLAMTEAEMAAASSLPANAAWMACHFSPYSTGLCSLPQQLPPDSLLILNDRTPIHGHDPSRIARELNDTIERFQCPGLLLDFQNPGCTETMELTRHLTETIRCPIGISPQYHMGNAALFLPAPTTHKPLSQYLAPWKGQTIWLETALSGQTITLTQEGAQIVENAVNSPLPHHTDAKLHCHYHIQIEESRLTFQLWRTREDLQALLDEAENLGVKLAVGLYQELGESAIDAPNNL